MRRRFLSIAALLMLLTLSVLVPVAFADDDGDDDGGGGPAPTQCPPSLTSVTHVVNGDFEVRPVGTGFRPVAHGDSSEMPPWIPTGNPPTVPVDHIGDYWEAASLVHSVDMEGTESAGTLEQVVLTEIGEQYRLCFAYAANPDNCPRADDGMEVRWSGVLVATVTTNCAGRTHTNMDWQYTSVTVTGTGVDVLRFQSSTTGSHGVALDDVSLVSQVDHGGGGDDDDDDGGEDDDDDDGGEDDDDDGGGGGILP